MGHRGFSVGGGDGPGGPGGGDGGAALPGVASVIEKAGDAFYPVILPIIGFLIGLVVIWQVYDKLKFAAKQSEGKPVKEISNQSVRKQLMRAQNAGKI